MKSKIQSTTKSNDALYKASLLWIALMVAVALFAPVIANDKPILIQINNEWHFPALSGNETISLDEETGYKIELDVTDTDRLNEINATYLMPPVRFYPNKSDIINSNYKSPAATQLKRKQDGSVEKRSGLDRHLLGTGKRGDDLLSGLIHGTRISITAGILSMILAGCIGIVLGSAAGYFGDNSISIKRSSLFTGSIGIVPAWFYSVQMRTSSFENALENSPAHFWMQVLISAAIFTVVILASAKAGIVLRRIYGMNKTVNIPLDSIISRCIEIFTSIPSLILIISLAAVSKPSLVNLIMIIGLTSWTEIARLTRAEMLRLRQLDFVAAARGLAYKEWYILFRHGLPNAISPAMVAISFGIASAILIESGLTFLGIGVPHDIATWGSLLYSGKENFNAWWLVVFPGMAIFLTVTAFNLIGEYLRDRWDPRTAAK